MVYPHYSRKLLITADDYGIGPNTSRGILDLAEAGAISATVLLVNSPYAEVAVRDWRTSQVPLVMGWHPCLTLDRPVLDPELVPSLVNAAGQFHSLNRFLIQLFRGEIKPQEIRIELKAQLEKFKDLTGRDPALVNAHHHIHIFPIVGNALRFVLKEIRPKPYIRCIREPWSSLFLLSGSRGKRLFLNYWGRAEAIRQEQEGFRGNQWLAGINDTRRTEDASFFSRWLRSMPGSFVELTCHPGLLDPSLEGRDGSWTDGKIFRRADEYHWLLSSQFRDTIQECNFSWSETDDFYDEELIVEPVLNTITA